MHDLLNSFLSIVVFVVVLEVQPRTTNAEGRDATQWRWFVGDIPCYFSLVSRFLFFISGHSSEVVYIHVSRPLRYMILSSAFIMAN